MNSDPGWHDSEEIILLRLSFLICRMAVFFTLRALVTTGKEMSVNQAKHVAGAC